MRAMVATALAGSWPMAVSPESITALEPSNTALATSEVSARVGVGACTIDSSICVAVIAGRPSVMQRWRMRFWMCGSSSIGQLRAEVAARHHDRARGLDDAVEVLDGGAGLDLGDDEGAARVRLGADPADVVGRAHEADRHHVDALVDERVEQLQVVGGGRREAQPLGRDVHARPPEQHAAVGDRGEERVVGGRLDLGDHGAVAEQHAVAGVEVGQQRRRGRR